MTVALFVPGDRPERFDKASTSGADAVVLDLEDAVAGDRKDLARDAVRVALNSGRQAWVRVNAVRSADGQKDLAMLAEFVPAAIMVPKVADRTDIEGVLQAVAGVPIVALIESIAGLYKIDEIAVANGTTAIALGGYDLCAELGARPTPEVLAPLRLRTILAARGASVQALDTPFAGIDDESGLTLDSGRAVDFGFDGKLAIHPKQVPIIQAVFEPEAAEVERALALIEAGSAGGATRFSDSMIDAPLLAAARRILSRAHKRRTNG